MTNLESFSFALIATLLTVGGIALVNLGHKTAGFWFVLAGGLTIGFAQLLFYKLERDNRSREGR